MTKVHFLGITGSGASAAAAIAKAQGFEVTGCDKNPSHEFVEKYEEFSVEEGHSPKHLYCHPERSEGYNPKKLYSSGPKAHQNDSMIDILAITPAVLSLDPNNEEIAEAKKRGIEILTWQEFMGKYLQKDKFVIAVCGTHGKSTTTAMIAQILEDANLDPTVLLGAIVPRWKANYRVGKGKFFIVEADEFNDNFLPTKPDITVVTNIEMDHPEYFKDFNAYLDSFENFIGQTKQSIVANLQDEWIAEILKIVMKKIKVTAVDFSKHELNLPLQIPGKFNQMNASAAFQVGLLLGLDPTAIRRSLTEYGGIGRRFEHVGSYKNREVYSDFGHHPTEIKTTAEALREKFPDKYIWLIYQPHMFSRTKGLFKEFVEVFKNLPVNQALILDIYPSREVDTGLISSSELADAVDKSNVDFVSNDKLKTLIDEETHQGDILFFMGAGDIDQIARGLIKSY